MIFFKIIVCSKEKRRFDSSDNFIIPIRSPHFTPGNNSEYAGKTTTKSMRKTPAVSEARIAQLFLFALSLWLIETNSSI